MVVLVSLMVSILMMVTVLMTVMTTMLVLVELAVPVVSVVSTRTTHTNRETSDTPYESKTPGIYSFGYGMEWDGAAEYVFQTGVGVGVCVLYAYF